MSEVTLTINGTEFGGWQSVKIARALDTLAASFSLDLTDRWEAEDERRPIFEHAACTVAIDGATVIDGFVDTVEVDYDDTTHSVSVSGRSRTGQLADCAAAVETGELKGQSLTAVARRLSDPYGVTVIDRTFDAATPFSRVEIEAGETVAELLERLTRQRGVFMTDTPEGDLLLTRRGETVQAAIGDGDWLSASASFDGTGVFSDVTVKGQREGADSLSAEAAAAPVGRAFDAAVPLYRPRILLSETQGDDAALQDRATYEVALRRGRARTWTYRFASWQRPDGGLWRVGQPIEVSDRFMGLEKAVLLVVRLTFEKGEQGTETALTVGLPEGYDLRAIPAEKAEATGWNA